MRVETMQIGDFDLTTIVTSPPWFENCYIVTHKSSEASAIVDPGGDYQLISQVVRDKKLKLQVIWLTHGHPDHVGAVTQLQEEFNIPCLAHADEEEILKHAGRTSLQLMGQFINGPQKCQFFNSENPLLLGQAKAVPIHTPGHTPGCVCYDLGAFVLTGDTLFDHGFGRTDLMGGNPAKLTSSITRLLNHLKPDTLLFSGHGPYWTAGEAKEWWKFMTI